MSTQDTMLGGPMSKCSPSWCKDLPVGGVLYSPTVAQDAPYVQEKLINNTSLRKGSCRTPHPWIELILIIKYLKVLKMGTYAKVIGLYFAATPSQLYLHNTRLIVKSETSLVSKILPHTHIVADIFNNTDLCFIPSAYFKSSPIEQPIGISE